ncbi:hypothetical protein [Streptomyces sp. 2A115]
MTDSANGDGIGTWLDEVWARTEAAVILQGGDGGGPLVERRIRG